MPIPVVVPGDGNCPMPLFTYVPESVVSEYVVVNNARESSCKCYGQDCLSSKDECQCMAKNGGNTVYTADGRLRADWIRQVRMIHFLV